MSDRYLELTWSTSRGRDTYGYNICKLSTGYRGKTYRTCGGGYDMTGTVLGDFIEAEYQDRLQEISGRAGAMYGKNMPYTSVDRSGPDAHIALYGMTVNLDTGHVSIDGACGVSSVQRIGEAIGLQFRATLSARKGHVTGYIVSDARDNAEVAA